MGWLLKIRMVNDLPKQNVYGMSNQQRTSMLSCLARFAADFDLHLSTTYDGLFQLNPIVVGAIQNQHGPVRLQQTLCC